MEKLCYLTLFFFLFSFHATAQIVSIPDANFKAILVANTNINTNADTEIQITEAQSYNGSISVSSANISDLTGIEAFTAITNLDCSYNQLISLDISNNLALNSLSCIGNQLSALNINNNTALSSLDCGANQLSSLATSSNAALATLICNNNPIPNLDLSSNTALSKLVCSAAQLATLQLNSNTLLDTLICSYNQIGNLDLSNNSLLKHLECQHNQLSTLNLGTISNLEAIYCYNNADLAALDLLNCSALERLECYFCNLQSLDLSNSPALVAIGCYNNILEYLNVQNGNNTNFTDFDAQNNSFLTCIMVDSVAYANANWSFIDPASTFATFCTALGITSISNASSFSIYPNPVQGKLNLLVPENFQPQYYTVLNLQGKALLQQQWTSNSISLPQLPAGLYFIQLFEANGHRQIGQFLKE